MSVWTDEQLSRWALRTEEKFCQEYDCLIDRLPIPVQEDTSIYTLPDFVLNIRRITYRGTKLYPISHRDQRDYLDGPNPSGTPTNYVYDNQGLNTIKLWPTPIEHLTPEPYIDLFNPDNIRDYCIVEFYAAANGIEYKLPDYIRRKYLRHGVARLAYTAEGKGQNLKAAKYYKLKEQALLELYGDQLIDQLNQPRRLIFGSTTVQSARYLPASPVLPSNFGVGVDPGE